MLRDFSSDTTCPLAVWMDFVSDSACPLERAMERDCVNDHEDDTHPVVTSACVLYPHPETAVERGSETDTSSGTYHGDLES